MIDLSNETLIPLKTLAKIRDGRTVVFIADHTRDVYRFCPPDTSTGIYTVRRNGQVSPNHQSQMDIISIARPWVPKNGERVRVIGYAQKQGNNEADVIADSIETKVDDGSHLPSEDLVFIRNQFGRYLVDKRQLRRWVTPVASEGPQYTITASTIPF